jgi:hypothetical protein
MSGRGALTGLFVLDEARSDPPTAHLAALGLGDLAQSAATRINATVSLRLQVRGSEATIVHISSLGEKERRLVFGEPLYETGRDGTPIRITAELVASSTLRLHVDYGKARITETKTLLDHDTLQQEIAMVLRGVHTRTVRIFSRTTPESAAALAAAAATAAEEFA